MADTDTFLPKLSDEEKKVLIKFYKENPALWNSSDPYYKNNVQISLIKTKLLTVFENKYTEDVLEKAFQSLRTSMLREVKKLDNGIIPKKIWKFFDDMEFLRGDLNKKKGVQFEADELERIIDFYRENASLWNHHLNEYRDRNLREVLLDKLAVEFNGKFTVADLKQQWHNLISTYKREKQQVDCSKSSGSGTTEVYVSNWKYFTSMRFIDVTSDIDESHTSLGESLVPQSKKRKPSAKEDEQTAKAELWKALTTQLSQGSSLNSHTESNLNAKQGATQQEDRAYVFGRTVADSLLQCDTKDWPRLKKKIMDIIFEFEEQKLTSNRFNQTTTPYSNQQQQAYAELLRNVYPSSAQNQQPIIHNNVMSPTNQCSSQVAFSPSNSNTHSNSSDYF